MKKCFIPILMAFLAFGCTSTSKKEQKTEVKSKIQQKVEEFAPFKLTTNLSALTEKEKQMIPLLLDAAKIMDEIFWMEAFGDKDKLFTEEMDKYTREFLKINYGPWERLNNNEPFLEGYGPKPAGANFYPADMTKAEFEAWEDSDKTSLYTLIRRDENGNLKSVPYHVAFEAQVEEAAGYIREAAKLAEDPGLKNYLEKRAEALLTDEYYESDVAWMEMKNNTIEFIVGPIENYEDQLFGYKTAHEAFILIKDKVWSRKLEKYAALLPGLQEALPCPSPYKNETPGMDSDMNVYDAIYYAGDCNAGSKTIAINLPNDEKVRETKGSRKLQLKNSMKAKFDKILVPIASLLIAEEQRSHVSFDAFFENTMFHEVAHGLGLGQTVDKSTTVREALKDAYTSIEESKADILGLWCVYRLSEMGELGEKEMMDNFVTFMAGIFRSVRFGAASAHGKANMMRFYYFQEAGAFERDPETGTYRVDFQKMKEAMFSLSETILKIQGDGDYEKARQMIDQKGFIREMLQNDLDRINEAGIPLDIVFEQEAEIPGIVSPDDFQFLENMTKDVMESSRIYPKEEVTPAVGPNNTGGTLIRPGGRDCYPAFWIRDYAMSLESGLIPLDEQKHMLQLTAETQCDQAWITKGGGLVPAGAIADHIDVATSEPLFYPGTQAPDFGILPTLDDHFFFIHMAYSYIKKSSDDEFLLQAIDGIPLLHRLEMAYMVPTTRNDSPIVYTTENLRGVDFGFRDVITITGDLCFTSILKYRASNELAWLFERMDMKQKAEEYRDIAEELKNLIPDMFYGPRGMLKASTGKSQQPDVWGTALAVYFGILEGKDVEKTSRFFADSYLDGTLSYKGNIRHILTTDDYSDSTAWEISYFDKNTYQNGAYWGTPVGWVAYTIAQTNPGIAKKLVSEYIQELRANDYRKGEDYDAPYECFHPSGYKQNPVYLATVTCPYAVLKIFFPNDTERARK